MAAPRRERGIVENMRGPDCGFIKAENFQQLLYFRSTDFENPQDDIRTGDFVEFLVVENPKTGVPNAKGIARRREEAPPEPVVVPKATPNVMTEREQGIVRTVRDKYGFIRRQNNDDIFYHASEVQEQMQHLSVGDEVEFSISLNHSTGKLNAMRLKSLPRGTVVKPKAPSRELQWETARDGNNYVPAPPAASSAAPQAGEVETGVVEAIKGAFGFIKMKDVKKSLFFHLTEVVDNENINPGDSIEFQIVTNNRNGKRNARFVKITERGKGRYVSERAQSARESRFNANPHITKGEREQGIIRRVKESFGFIECATREDEVFFHASEVFENRVLHPRDEVEFAVISNSQTNKFNAVEIKVLPQGTVSLPERKPKEEPRLTGTVEAMKGSYGFIQCEEYGEKSVFFKLSDVENGITVRDGDEVEFSVWMNKRNGEPNARNVTSKDRAMFKSLLARQAALPNKGRVIDIYEPERQPNGPSGRGFCIGREGEKSLSEPSEAEASEEPTAEEALEAAAAVAEVTDAPSQ